MTREVVIEVAGNVTVGRQERRRPVHGWKGAHIVEWRDIVTIRAPLVIAVCSRPASGCCGGLGDGSRDSE